jgi:cytochrome P450
MTLEGKIGIEVILMVRDGGRWQTVLIARYLGRAAIRQLRQRIREIALTLITSLKLSFVLLSISVQSSLQTWCPS